MRVCYKKETDERDSTQKHIRAEEELELKQIWKPERENHEPWKPGSFRFFFFFSSFSLSKCNACTIIRFYHKSIIDHFFLVHSSVLFRSFCVFVGIGIWFILRRWFCLLCVVVWLLVEASFYFLFLFWFFFLKNFSIWIC